MFDLIYRFDTSGNARIVDPVDALEARARLEAGNREFAAITLLDEGTTNSRVVRLDASALGLADSKGLPPLQRPFAAVLGCADARVPIELIFGQAANDLFVVRVAGNVLGAECLGSLDYAVSNLGGSLKLIVVLGHSSCGAVGAAVEAFIHPHRYLDFATSHPLRAVIERILVAVRAAHRALEQIYTQDVEEIPGYRNALHETSIIMNAAITAATLKCEFREALGPQLDVAYGVYDLQTRRVGLQAYGEPDVVRLVLPPSDAEEFDRLGRSIAQSDSIRAMLATRIGERD